VAYDTDLVNNATYAVTIEQAGGSPDGIRTPRRSIPAKLVETVRRPAPAATKGPLRPSFTSPIARERSICAANRVKGTDLSIDVTPHALLKGERAHFCDEREANPAKRKTPVGSGRFR